LRKSSQTDELADTVDYVHLNKIVVEEMAIRSKLLEHVAQRIITRCFAEIPSYICNPNKQWRRGRAARHRSAKPSTPVRIRTMPLKPSKKLEGFFM
jgi:hypothetical protein